MAAPAYVTYELSDDGVATIEFGTPAHNSLPTEQLTHLVEAFARAHREDACRVVVLRSGGSRTFCAGASFDELRAIQNPAEGAVFFAGFAGVINAIRTCDKLVIGRVQGKAVGGGVGLIAACDIAYASRYAAVRLSEIALGIGPFVIAPALRRRIGAAALSEWSLHPTTFFDAAVAKTRGLYAEVFDEAAALDSAVLAKAKELSSYGPAASAAWKRALWAGTEHWGALLDERATMSGQLVTLPAAREAIGRSEV